MNLGMNSFLRPSLYGSCHEIVNLSAEGLQKEKKLYDVVGPICESGDVLGYSRLLPKSSEEDLILLASTGAYGRVMASSYNRKIPASELVLD